MDRNNWLDSLKKLDWVDIVFNNNYHTATIYKIDESPRQYIVDVNDNYHNSARISPNNIYPIYSKSFQITHLSKLQIEYSFRQDIKPSYYCTKSNKEYIFVFINGTFHSYNLETNQWAILPSFSNNTMQTYTSCIDQINDILYVFCLKSDVFHKLNLLHPMLFLCNITKWKTEQFQKKNTHINKPPAKKINRKTKKKLSYIYSKQQNNNETQYDYTFSTFCVNDEIYLYASPAYKDGFIGMNGIGSSHLMKFNKDNNSLSHITSTDAITRIGGVPIYVDYLKTTLFFAVWNINYNDMCSWFERSTDIIYYDHKKKSGFHLYPVKLPKVFRRGQINYLLAFEYFIVVFYVYDDYDTRYNCKTKEIWWLDVRSNNWYKSEKTFSVCHIDDKAEMIKTKFNQVIVLGVNVDGNCICFKFSLYAVIPYVLRDEFQNVSKLVIHGYIRSMKNVMIAKDLVTVISTYYSFFE
eukprot:461992_1